MKFNFFVSIALLLLVQMVKAQTTSYPVIGKPMPTFRIDNVKYSSLATIDNQTIKGKNVILYMWAKNCSGCIESQPGLSALQQKFKDDLVLASVIYEEDKAEVLYDLLRKKHNLKLPFATLDKNRFEQIAPGNGVPIVIWISKAGIVKAITGGGDIKEKNVVDFLAGNEFKYNDATVEGKQLARLAEPDSQDPLFSLPSNVDTTFFYSSSFTKSRPDDPSICEGSIDFFLKACKLPKFEMSKFDLYYFYIWAYFGGIKPYLVNPKTHLLMRDTSVFRYSYLKSNMYGLYSYSLNIPKSKVTKQELMRTMQLDLEKYFGFRAAIEEVETDCYAMRVVDRNKISLLSPDSTKESAKTIKFMGGQLNNWDVDRAFRYLCGRLPNAPRIFNETAIKGRIKIEVNALMTEFDQLQKEFARYGLALVPIKKKLPTLVIRDSEPVIFKSEQYEK